MRRTEAAHQVLGLLRLASVGLLGAEAQELGLYGLQVTGRTGLPSGVVHPMLKRLDGRGLTASAWVNHPESSHPRRYYRLTPAGVALAQQWINESRGSHGQVHDGADHQPDQQAEGAGEGPAAGQERQPVQ